MGGQIAVIKKHNNKIYSYDGWTNSLSNVTKKIEFLTNPDNKLLKEYFKYSDKFEGLYPINYGIFIVDYDNKNIYTINGYSSYLSIETSFIRLNQMSKSVNKDNYKELFNDNDLAISTEVYSKKQLLDSGYKNISELDFDNLNQLVNWLEKNQYVEENSITTHIRLCIDYKKYGWNYYDYDENLDGYIKLFKQLYKDGVKLNNKDINKWSEFLKDYYEEEPDSIMFKEKIKKYLRIKKLNRINGNKI